MDLGYILLYYWTHTHTHTHTHTRARARAFLDPPMKRILRLKILTSVMNYIVLLVTCFFFFFAFFFFFFNRDRAICQVLSWKPCYISIFHISRVSLVHDEIRGCSPRLVRCCSLRYVWGRQVCFYLFIYYWFGGGGGGEGRRGIGFWGRFF